MTSFSTDARGQTEMLWLTCFGTYQIDSGVLHSDRPCLSPGSEVSRTDRSGCVCGRQQLKLDIRFRSELPRVGKLGGIRDSGTVLAMSVLVMMTAKREGCGTEIAGDGCPQSTW